MAAGVRSGLLDASDVFDVRHIGPSGSEVGEMLAAVGSASMGDLIAEVIPEEIRLGRELDLGEGLGEHAALRHLRSIADQNSVFRSCIGMGYSGTITPPVILRNILENPGWYTQYTPYQAEISQGRLEALLNFQTMISDLTGLPLANASLLDEGTAAAEAMSMCRAIAGGKRGRFFVAEDCHPQTIAVVQTRAKSMGIEIEVGSWSDASAKVDDLCGALVQYPGTDGGVRDYTALCDQLHAGGAMLVVAADLLALTLLKTPGEMGADIAVGSAQRFGVPMGFGGPHAAYMSTHEKHARKMPGRIVGVSKDSAGNQALRLAVQTREQHIRRDRATSNICTAQVLLAIMSGMYAVYHGPDGLRRIAERTRAFTLALGAGIRGLGHEVLGGEGVFDTLRVDVGMDHQVELFRRAGERRINLRNYGDGTVGVSLDETTDRALFMDLLAVFGAETDEDGRVLGPTADELLAGVDTGLPAGLARESAYLTHPVFNTHHSETELLRYIFKLQQRDLSLAHSMIPLGSCTMKLNATSEMLPVTWPEFAHIHPFAPEVQARGYEQVFNDLRQWLGELTGLPAVSLQPNAGSQGEYAGLLVIKAYHESRGDTHRDVCLIPESAHGTNPASAVIAGMRIVPVKCVPEGDATGGDIDVDDLRAKAEQHKDELAALMVTYPSTRGVFGTKIGDVCDIVHEFGGQVYMDGANMNAQVGLCRPGDFGADVCHLNLHKTFCIPHGGGGPGMGPIAAQPHLAPFLPTHPVMPPDSAGGSAVGAVSAAPMGSPSILTISWMYIAMMGAEGLRRASEVAVLNANYMAKRLEGHFDIVFTNAKGRVAHEFILDCRGFKKTAGIEIDDIAKRLIDYGFHAPTMSWPVAGTLMIEPTESEPKPMLDRFCDALIAIRAEIARIESGEWAADSNPLKHAPHTAFDAARDDWDRAYPRELGVFPDGASREHKFWPAVGRVDNPFGDRNLVCSCPPMDTYSA